MGIIEPGIGLLFWMTLLLLSYYFLAKFAWKPIVNAVNEEKLLLLMLLTKLNWLKKRWKS
jgi:F-type H+-transporting ATPase subunit b